MASRGYYSLLIESVQRVRAGSEGPEDICKDGERVFCGVLSRFLVPRREITNQAQADGADSNDRICRTVDGLWLQSTAYVAMPEF